MSHHEIQAFDGEAAAHRRVTEEREAAVKRVAALEKEIDAIAEAAGLYEAHEGGFRRASTEEIVRGIKEDIRLAGEVHEACGERDVARAEASDLRRGVESALEKYGLGDEDGERLAARLAKLLDVVDAGGSLAHERAQRPCDPGHCSASTSDGRATCADIRSDVAEHRITELDAELVERRRELAEAMGQIGRLEVERDEQKARADEASWCAIEPIDSMKLVCVICGEPRVNGEPKTAHECAEAAVAAYSAERVERLKLERRIAALEPLRLAAIARGRSQRANPNDRNYGGLWRLDEACIALAKAEDEQARTLEGRPCTAAEVEAALGLIKKGGA